MEIKKPEDKRPTLGNQNVEEVVKVEPVKPEIKPVIIPTVQAPKIERPTIQPEPRPQMASSGGQQQMQQQVAVAPPPAREEPSAPKVNDALKSHILSKMKSLVETMDNRAGEPEISYFYEEPEEQAASESDKFNNPWSETEGMQSGQTPNQQLSQQFVNNAMGSNPYSQSQMGEGGETAAPTLADYGIDLPLAGNILYAQMVSRANSDAPGPIVAEIVQGELAGSKILGSFTVANEALIIEFNTLSVGTTLSGKEVNASFPISSVAVETKYIGTALATSVDRHLFERIAVTFGTTFLGQMGSLMTSQGTTQTTLPDGTVVASTQPMTVDEITKSSAYTAVGEVGNIANEIYGARPTTVIVESGTPIGILFLN